MNTNKTAGMYLMPNMQLLPLEDKIMIEFDSEVRNIFQKYYQFQIMRPPRETIFAGMPDNSLMRMKRIQSVMLSGDDLNFVNLQNSVKCIHPGNNWM